MNSNLAHKLLKMRPSASLTTVLAVRRMRKKTMKKGKTPMMNLQMISKRLFSSKSLQMPVLLHSSRYSKRCQFTARWLQRRKPAPMVKLPEVSRARTRAAWGMTSKKKLSLRLRGKKRKYSHRAKITPTRAGFSPRLFCSRKLIQLRQLAVTVFLVLSRDQALQAPANFFHMKW